jgi:hypothetical protein
MLEDIFTVAEDRGERRWGYEGAMRPRSCGFGIRIERIGFTDRGAEVRDHLGGNLNRVCGFEDAAVAN